MSTDGSVGEISSGFYIIYGNLGSLNNLAVGVRNYQHTGSASLVVNIYLDSDNDGEFFHWTPSGYFDSLAGDVYGLGPTTNPANTFHLLQRHYKFLHYLLFMRSGRQHSHSKTIETECR